MSDENFSTTAEVEVIVDSNSLRSARKEMEDKLSGAAMVEPTASEKLASGGGSMAGRGGASELLKEQQTTNQHFSENVHLNDTRNELLREIVENTGQGPGQGRGDFGRLGRFGGLSGLIGGGLALGALVVDSLSKINWSQRISNTLPDLNPGDILNPTDIGVGDVINDAPIGAAEFIGESLPLGSGDLVGDPFPLGAGALLGAAFPLGAGALLGPGFPIDPSDLVDGDGSGSGSGQSQSLIDRATDPRTVGSGLAAAVIGGTAGAASNLSLPGAASTSRFATATRGGATAGSLGSAALFTGGVAGTVYGSQQLADISTGGTGPEFAYNAGRDASSGNLPGYNAGRNFARSNPETAEDINEAFTDNVVTDTGQGIREFGQDVGEDARNDEGLFSNFANGGIVTGPTNARIGEGGETEAVFPLSRLENFMSGQQSGGGGGDGGSTSVSAPVTVEKVEVSGDSRRDIVNEVVRQVRREMMRELPDDLSREMQRGFETKL